MCFFALQNFLRKIQEYCRNQQQTDRKTFLEGQILTDKELKKLNRYQLLELIIMQSEELERVKAQLAEAQQQLQQRSIQLEKAGNIAQAALQLSGIFEAAQKAADLYLENVKQQCGQTEKTDGALQNKQAGGQSAQEIITADIVEQLIKGCTEQTADRAGKGKQ